MGGSYGGYATLAGVAFTPDLYAAAVSIVGPSNLITLLDSIPPYWEAGRKMFYMRMGDPTTPEGKKQLERQSPLNSADKIKTPLLVVQGANDPRVKKAESDSDRDRAARPQLPGRVHRRARRGPRLRSARSTTWRCTRRSRSSSRSTCGTRYQEACRPTSRRG